MLYRINGAVLQLSHYSWKTDSSTSTKNDHQILLSEADCLFLQKIRDLVEMKLEDMHFGNKELSKKMHMSISQLYRKIKALTGKSTSIYIRSIAFSLQ